MENYEILKKEILKEILKEIPGLLKLEVGQLFHSKFYGIIVATKITRYSEQVYSIYGFDEKDGLPRDCYYPRDIDLVGKEIMLNDLLIWHSLKGRNKYSHFEVASNGEAYFSIYDGEQSESISWYLAKPYLKDQSQELIDWLIELI